MENQNSTPEEKKKLCLFHGKKRKVIIAVLAVLFLFGFIGRGIAFRAALSMRGHPFMQTGNIALAVKDFESKGIVFAESTSTMRGGYRAIYNALMKEASQKGADAIINVSISSTGKFFNRTLSGSATAIKYLDAMPGETMNMPSLGLFGRRGFGHGWGRN
jgi:hypothetical protein